MPFRVFPERCLPALSSLPGATPAHAENADQPIDRGAVALIGPWIVGGARGVRPEQRHAGGVTGQNVSLGERVADRADGVARAISQRTLDEERLPLSLGHGARYHRDRGLVVLLATSK